MPAAFRKPEFTLEERTGTVIRLVVRPQPGDISGAAKEHGVSRQHMSKLVSETREAVARTLEPKAPGRPRKTIDLPEGEDFLNRLMVTLIANGVSYDGIQDILGLLPVHVSHGKIRQVLADAAQRATQMNASLPVPTNPIYVEGDEIYFRGKPVLLLVDERSLAVLIAASEDAADENTWGCHLLEQKERGVQFAGFISDQGTGLAAGWKASGINAQHQSDVFHTERDARRIACKLEKQARKAAASKEAAWARLEDQTNPHRGPGRPRKPVTENELQRLEAAADTAASLADDAAYLTNEMRRSLSPLHSDGSRRTVTEAQDELMAIAELLSTIADDDARKLGHNLPDRIPGLTYFFSPLEAAWQPWEERDKEATSFVGWVWNNRKALGEKLPVTDDEVREQWGIDMPVEGVQAIWDSLEYLHRASSLVECVNSILRKHAQAHRGLTPDLLNLLIFRHNARVFPKGKRAGTSPIQILSGGPVWAHWTDGLFGPQHPEKPEVQQKPDTLQIRAAA